MTVQQIYELMNKVTGEALGEGNVLAEDLTNIVQIGDAIQNVMGLDNYVRSLVDHIGRTIFVDRVYSGRTPSILRDGWEYGSILEKVAYQGLPEAQENEAWNLQDGAVYEENQFYQPKVTVKFYNDAVTFMIPMSFTEMQVKSSFSNAGQLNGFISMIRNAIANSMTVKIDELIRRALNNFISEVVYTNDGVTYVKLLTLYNNTLPDIGGATPITAEEFMRTPDAMKFAINKFYNYIDYLAVMNTRFNLGHQPRFTPKERLQVIMLSAFKNAASVYLDSDTFHEEYVALPQAESIPYFQGSGTSFAFEDISNINVTNSYGHSVNVDNIVAIMFDKDAVGVANQDTHVTNKWNAVGEFWNEWVKAKMSLWNDTNENFIVFALN